MKTELEQAIEAGKCSDRFQSYTQHTINGHTVCCLWDKNPFYGNLLVQWQVDGRNFSEVRTDRQTNQPIPLQISYAGCAHPPYVRDMIEEELLEPLGIGTGTFVRLKTKLLVTKAAFLAAVGEQ